MPDPSPPATESNANLQKLILVTCFLTSCLFIGVRVLLQSEPDEAAGPVTELAHHFLSEESRWDSPTEQNAVRYLSRQLTALQLSLRLDEYARARRIRRDITMYCRSLQNTGRLSPAFRGEISNAEELLARLGS